MRNIRRHEHVLEKVLVGICRVAMAASRSLGASLPDEGDVRVNFDDSIITDTSAEKQQDMAEVAAGLMLSDEYQEKWYGMGEPAPIVSRVRLDATHRVIQITVPMLARSSIFG